MWTEKEQNKKRGQKMISRITKREKSSDSLSRADKRRSSCTAHNIPPPKQSNSYSLLRRKSASGEEIPACEDSREEVSASPRLKNKFKDVVHSFHGHMFAYHDFEEPSFCLACEEFVWSSGKDAFELKCLICQKDLHTKCFEEDEAVISKCKSKGKILSSVLRKSPKPTSRKLGKSRKGVSLTTFTVSQDSKDRAFAKQHSAHSLSKTSSLPRPLKKQRSAMVIHQNEAPPILSASQPLPGPPSVSCEGPEVALALESPPERKVIPKPIKIVTSTSPSTAPHVSPRASPSTAPRVSPTTAPRISPSTAPRVSPSTAPRISPSTAPRISPSGSPLPPPLPKSPVGLPSGMLLAPLPSPLFDSDARLKRRATMERSLSFFSFVQPSTSASELSPAIRDSVIQSETEQQEGEDKTSKRKTTGGEVAENAKGEDQNLQEEVKKEESSEKEEEGGSRESSPIEDLQFYCGNEGWNLQGGSLKGIVKFTILVAGNQEYFDFLLVYRHFSKPKALAEEIIQLFEDISNGTEEFVHQIELCKKKIQPNKGEQNFDLQRQTNQNMLRFCNFCKKWITEFFEDFAEDEELLSRFEQFVEEKLSGEKPAFAKKLKDSLERRMEQVRGACAIGLTRAEASRNTSAHNLLRQTERIVTGGKKTKRSISKKLTASHPKDLIEITPWEVAQQLTIRDSALYCSIQPWEVVTPSCWKDDTSHLPLVSLVSHFNRIGSMLGECILSFERLETRARALALWIRVANHCLDINNYNGAMEVYAGLNQLPIFRLKHTLSVLSEDDKKRMQKLDDLLAPHAGYVKLKTAVSASPPPCVPYMGLYLSDMTYILDGMPSKLANGFINYQKFQTCADLVQQIRLFQDVKYTFEEIPIIQSFFENHPVLSEGKLYEMSLECEKRGGR